MNPLTHFKKTSSFCLLLFVLLGGPFSRTFAQSPPLDLWSADTQLTIRDKNTLNYSITAQTGYFEVYFDSNNNATWADAGPYKCRACQKPFTAIMGTGIRTRRCSWRRSDTSHSPSMVRGKAFLPDRLTRTRDGFRLKKS